MVNELLSRMALAFGVGLLIGLERGWNSRQVKPGGRAAGVRTFAITGLLGGLIGALARTQSNGIEIPGALLIALALVAFSGVVTIFSLEENRASGNRSATTAVAAVLTFVLGIHAIVGNVHVTTAVAVTAAGVLALREGIHGWIEKITRRELESGLLLLSMTFIALPLVPARPVGPFGGVNLREIWLIAIVLAAISFAAYIAVKYFGEKKGVLLSALLGGIVSSTAVAFASARRAAAGEAPVNILAAATAIATAVSFLRVIAIASVLSPSVTLGVGIPLVAAMLVACGLAALMVYRSPRDGKQNVGTTFSNPFGFWSVLLVAALMGVLIVLGRYVNDRFGAAGTIVGAASMGLFDVDAMTVSMARLVPEALSPLLGAEAILVGVASNTLVKVLIAGAIARGRFAVQVALFGAGCLLAGAIAALGVRAMS